MVNVFDGPGQLVPPLVKVGTTIIVPVMGAVPGFVAVNEISPVPDAPRPIDVFELVHAYVVVPPPLTVEKFTVPGLLLHKTMFRG